MSPEIQQLNKALQLLSTLHCHKRNPVSLFNNILKTGASFLSTPLVNWKMEDMHTLIRVSWAASGSLLKSRLYDFNDYDDDWARF